MPPWTAPFDLLHSELLRAVALAPGLFGLDTDVPAVAWVVLPLLIFLARTVDMSLSTLRIVFIAQGRTALAAAVGFWESLIWLVVVSQALQHLDNPLCVVAYAGGFAAGNSVGLLLERRLAMGHRLLRVILPSDDPGRLVDEMRALGHGVTIVHGEGMRGDVRILFTIARRRHLQSLIELIRERHPQAFFAVEDVRQAQEGVYLAPSHRTKKLSFTRWLRWRHGR